MRNENGMDDPISKKEERKGDEKDNNEREKESDKEGCDKYDYLGKNNLYEN